MRGPGPPRAAVSEPRELTLPAMTHPPPATAPGQYDHVCAARCETHLVCHAHSRCVPAPPLAAAFDPGCVTELQCRYLPLSTAPAVSNWNALGMNQVSRTSHLAFRRHLAGRHVDLDIVGLPDHVVRDAAGLAETGAGDNGDRSVEPEPDLTLQGVNEVRVHVVPVPTRLFAERLACADVLTADAATHRFRPSAATAALSASASSGRVVGAYAPYAAMKTRTASRR
jgi:hypothetical protein